MFGQVGGDGVLLVALMLLLKITPVVLGIAAALWLLPRLKVGRSLLGNAGESNDQGERILLLENEVARLREEMAEVLERQDFAERLLTPDRPLPERRGSGPRTPTPREVTPVS